jgi:hypothetical protein
LVQVNGGLVSADAWFWQVDRYDFARAAARHAE